jgi:hypothetical protein
VNQKMNFQRLSSSGIANSLRRWSPLPASVAGGILAAVSVEGGLSGGHVIAVDMKRPGATSTGIHGHSLGRGDWVQNTWRVVGHRMEVYANSRKFQRHG